MREPSTPSDEPERLRSLRALDILDTPPEERFDRLTRIAQYIFEVPIALVSLVDAERQWFKSRQGLEATETARNISFCGHAILGEEAFVVPDASADERFHDNPLVSGPPDIRFYAGVPLETSGGQAVGTLCIIDRKPRSLDAAQLQVLHDLADCVEEQLELGKIRQMARDFHDQQAYLRAIMDTVVDAILTIDERGIIQTVNPAATRIFGREPKDMIGRHAGMLLPEWLAREFDTLLAECRRAGASKTVNFKREAEGRRHGEVFSMTFAMSEMWRDGKLTFVAIACDITDRKRIDRMKSEFVSTVSHELRTPLTSIRGALGLLVGMGMKGLSPKERQLLEMAERNSERLAVLINDILDLEKISSGRLEFQFKAIDLVEVVRQAVAANEGYAHRHNVRLRLTGAPEQAEVYGDEHRLMQVLANLVSNAVKFSKPGGEVEVAVSAREGWFRVSVKDHGRGIPESFRGRIFQRFAQADSSDTREKGGTGLGLSISKAIIKRHGGIIDYVSQEDVGTEFFFEIPEYRRIAPDSVGDGAPRLLICEDNSEVGAVLAELLAQEGMASDIAASAGAARDLLARTAYHGLLLDLALPDADGVAFIGELRATDATRELPIVVVSGRATEERGRWRGDALPVIDWLQKPVDRERLSRAVKQAVGSHGRPAILHVEDDLDVVQVVQALVRDVGDYAYATSLAEAQHELAQRRFDLVILDVGMPDGSGTELLAGIESETPVIIFSGEEVDGSVVQRVCAALTKTRTSNEHLLATIKQAVQRKGV